MDFFNARGIPVEIIPLNGSIELAPLLGLADRIVDLGRIRPDIERKRTGNRRSDRGKFGATDRQSGGISDET